ncbi:MAG: saccharopine dehydrogenase NADP-binding domain-containing protein [Bacteroidales bacterium]|nr:saccharopine dehydrogenase NADP-binding domain-containing protein [Bacteroidales bacterium]MCF8389976.1 saccharopine dehydrogenase NADP-binding domain-containing protein [Bacteroidales bacterium]
MKRILILGAGLSSKFLINYLLEHAESSKWHIRLGDISLDLAKDKINNHPRGEALFFNVDNPEQLMAEIREANLVVSMLPAKFHFKVAKECVRFGVNMVTASYVSDEIKSLDKEAREKGVLLMNEVGVDPGIDHMSAMQVINRLKDEGSKLIAFESSTGGLVAPNYDNNPWRYKFTWAPRNVVLAGAAGARFLHNSKFKYIPYHKLFSRYEIIDIPEYGQFEVYPNRDSLKYQSTYGLEELSTMFRGTIRRPSFCDAWNLLVQLGATDDTYSMDDTEHMTYRQFTNSFVAYNIVDSVEKKIAAYLGIAENSALMDKLKWLGLFDETVIGIPDLTPARVLQHILEKKWAMEPGDKDMIIMEHQFDYLRFRQHRKIYSTLVVIGEDSTKTAMAKTVGLPAAIVSRLILENKIDLTGVQIPVEKQVYEPVLHELKEYGIEFKERDVLIS